MNSNLQIISGQWRGRKLRLPPDARPTQNRARIALFNTLSDLRIMNGESRIEVWDAFAGSGAFGLECLSRLENARVIFTDADPGAIKAILKNLGPAKAENYLLSQADALSAAEKFGATADLIFVDPPYASHELGADLIKKLSAAAKSGAIAVWEMEKNVSLPALPKNMKILRDKTYGRARFLILAVLQG
jgi:16S rRNA (guanine966-N2)-methyltransferase